jgi:hypothetical protein
VRISARAFRDFVIGTFFVLISRGTAAVRPRYGRRSLLVNIKSSCKIDPGGKIFVLHINLQKLSTNKDILPLVSLYSPF